MKKLILAVLTMLNCQTSEGYWRIGASTGINKGYSAYAGETPTLWATEVFGRVERKKWAIGFALSHSKYSEASVFYGQGCFGPYTYSMQDAIYNDYGFTVSYQTRVLKSLSKKGRIRNDLGLATGLQYEYCVFKTTAFYPYDNIPPALSRGSVGSATPYVGLIYSLSATVTSSISIVGTVRPQLMLDRYFSPIMSYNTINAMIGLSYDL